MALSVTFTVDITASECAFIAAALQLVEPHTKAWSAEQAAARYVELHGTLQVRMMVYAERARGGRYVQHALENHKGDVK